MLYYFLIGLAYWSINVHIRKIDTEGDYTLPFVWVFFFTLCFIALAIIKIQELKNKL